MKCFLAVSKGIYYKVYDQYELSTNMVFCTIHIIYVMVGIMLKSVEFPLNLTMVCGLNVACRIIFGVNLPNIAEVESQIMNQEPLNKTVNKLILEQC